MLLGEWLNGRVVVSKTIGCVFESRLLFNGEKAKWEKFPSPELNSARIIAQIILIVFGLLIRLKSA